MPWTTASQTNRTLYCPGSTRIKRSPTKADREGKSNRAAIKGTELHQLCYDVATGVEWDKCFESLSHRGAKRLARNLRNNSDFWEWLGSFDVYELSVAFNCATPSLSQVFFEKFLSREDRDARVPGNEWLTGTADLVSYRGRVWDLKFGKIQVEAENNDQLLTLAATISLVNPTDSGDWELGIAQVGNDGSLVKRVWNVTKSQVAAHRDKMVQAYKFSPGLRIGSWCSWCRSKKHCNEWNNGIKGE